MKKWQKILLASGIVVLAGVAGTAGVLYMKGRNYYSSHFYEGTSIKLTSPDGSKEIGSADFSDLTLDEAAQAAAALLNDYTITIKGAGDTEDVVKGQDVGISISQESTNAIGALLAGQGAGSWFTHTTDLKRTLAEQRVTVTQVATLKAAYDETKLAGVTEKLKSVNPDQVTEPQDAYLEFDKEAIRYVIHSAVTGNQADPAAVKEVLAKGLEAMADTVEIEGSFYAQPAITNDNAELVANMNKANKPLETKITLKDGDKSYVIEAKDIINLIKMDKDYNVTVDTAAINRFIAKTLDPIFDTVGQKREVTTPGSGSFTISGGTFGKLIQTYKERPKLIEEITNGTVEERLPCYYDYSSYDKGMGNGGIGKSYVDINIDQQKVYVVINGEIKASTDCVTGTVSTGHDTPKGTFFITRKLTEYTMVKYDAFVHFWMPFEDAQGVGLHDATWRGSFGGSIYKNSGSHGCVNLPLAKAKEIYSLVYAGMPVVVH